MIKRIELINFKRFSKINIDLVDKGVSILAGGNNSGKSSILHALATWEFGKLYIENLKGRHALYSGHRADGIGIGLEDFTPFNIPSLKYLWTNLSAHSGYTLKIKCIWDLPTAKDKFLEIGFAFNQERLFIKSIGSNLVHGDKIPTIAYLPPFAGMSDREQWYSPADRRKQIGRGLAGAVLRNTIIEMFNAFIDKKSKLKQGQKRISTKRLKEMMVSDSFCVLNRTIFDIFQAQLLPHYFSPSFHNFVKVDITKGSFYGERFVAFKNYNKRDIMVEGSGFLQVLSVFTFALNKEIDLLLLDEPDAHLHCTLQSLLIEKIDEISNNSEKQVLVATHSVELLRHLNPQKIIEIKNMSARYLTQEGQKIALIGGLGTEYAPKINKLQRVRRLLLVENESDAELIKIWSEKLGFPFPQNLVLWAFANNHKERKHLFLNLKDEIPGLIALSLEDRDNDLYEQTNSSLRESYPDLIEEVATLKYRRWRRWEIENYLISPETIARIAAVSEEEVREFISLELGVNIAPAFRQSDRLDATRPLFEVEGKAFTDKVFTQYGISKLDIAKNMTGEEVFEDVRTLVEEIIDMCRVTL